MFSALRGLIDWAPLGLPAFLFVITVVVFFHELGHFSMARAFGIRVETFSIGFGPAIVKWMDRKGTQWKISWIPLGGYVKFFGDLDAASVPDREHVKSLSEDERKFAYPLRPVYQRAAVAAAGPVANFILAVVILTILFAFVGARTASTYVGDVTPKSPAAEAGIKAGDKIVAVNGKKLTYFGDVRDAVAAGKGKPLDVQLLRGGKSFDVTIKPRSILTKDIYGTPVTFTGIGVAYAMTPQNTLYVPVPLAKAPEAAVSEVWAIVDTTFTYLGRMISGRADTTQLSGPIGIAKVSKSAASQGPYALIYLAALISVSIGLINLFPIPILDGGHLLYYGCEAAMGRPLGERAQDVGFRLGLAVVLGLLLLTTWNDLVRPNLF
ncbi:MAG: RIP metalloprotease RseP [Proteobacteria bacterium]|nr:RIP metalloprotease RseP [Pseudomonadota bacterium]